MHERCFAVNNSDCYGFQRFCTLEEIKVGSDEFSQNQKIVTDGFP